MPSTYLSFRCSVPWLILSLEAVFIVLIYFLFSDQYALLHYTGKTAHLAVKGRIFILHCSRVGMDGFVYW